MTTFFVNSFFWDFIFWRRFETEAAKIPRALSFFYSQLSIKSLFFLGNFILYVFIDHTNLFITNANFLACIFYNQPGWLVWCFFLWYEVLFCLSTLTLSRSYSYETFSAKSQKLKLLPIQQEDKNLRQQTQLFLIGKSFENLSCIVRSTFSLHISNFPGRNL